jgi:2-C-methyl-D-erythritol 4-phosphate cytidylyltransferase/2-C-methyl-D-erythritol 2,4-cyclodiphosphate synthase
MTATPNNSAPFHVLIAAAGRGQRFGKSSDKPKQYVALGSHAVIYHSIKIFQSFPNCKSIRVIIDPADAEPYQNSVTGLNLPPPFMGGKERNNSIYNGLNESSNIKNEEIILIHDAARPCVSKADISKLLDALQTNRAATLALPISATLRKQNPKSAEAAETIDRNGLWALQTPQGFRKGDLLAAHENLENLTSPPTDDTMLVSASGIAVELVRGSPENIKITYPEDMIMAEKLLRQNRTTLTGQGFDVHAFDDDKKGPVRLCGIDVPHTNALKGHSDADVGLHALTDALLGAIGEGDIGRHFPPSDNTYKNMDSAIFLERAVELARDKGARLVNADVTLICEQPKITPHAEAMRQRISVITGLSPERVNVKATTTEQLGFTGRGEGIAAQAIISVSLPDQSDG